MTASQAQLASPSRKRRWFQYRLRTLLVFVLLVSVGMSWFAIRMQRVRRQREAVRKLEEFPSQVAYDYGRQPSVRPNSPRCPIRLSSWLGDDWFSDVEFVCLSSEEFTDAEMAHLESLPRLKVLVLDSTSVTDAGLRHLHGLTRLEYLSLAGSGVTDAGLEQLKGLTRLKQLYLDDTQVTEEGVRTLQQVLPNCRIQR